jgi:hypothetical protein
MIKAIFIIVCCLVFFFIQVYLPWKKKQKKFQLPAEIKQAYTRLVVPTEAVLVKSRGYYEDDEKVEAFPNLNSVDIIDSIGGRPAPKVYKEISVLCHSIQVRGKAIVLSSTPIEMPVTDLKEKLALIRQIEIYYDPANMQHAYFDLSFLNRSRRLNNEIQ